MKKLILLAAVVMIAGCAKNERSAATIGGDGYSDAIHPHDDSKCKEGETYSSIGDYGSLVRGVYVCHGGKYALDTDGTAKAMEAWRAEEEKAAAAREKESEQKRKLYWALRTRVLTDKEMSQVEAYGDSIVTAYSLVEFTLSGDSDNGKEAEKRAHIFNAALLQQAKLRALAKAKP